MLQELLKIPKLGIKKKFVLVPYPAMGKLHKF